MFLPPRQFFCGFLERWSYHVMLRFREGHPSPTCVFSCCSCFFFLFKHRLSCFLCLFLFYVFVCVLLARAQRGESCARGPLYKLVKYDPHLAKTLGHMVRPEADAEGGEGRAGNQLAAPLAPPGWVSGPRGHPAAASHRVLSQKTITTQTTYTPN